jgi:hypothetical protein
MNRYLAKTECDKFLQLVLSKAMSTWHLSVKPLISILHPFLKYRFNVFDKCLQTQTKDGKVKFE